MTFCIIHYSTTPDANTAMKPAVLPSPRDTHAHPVATAAWNDRKNKNAVNTDWKNVGTPTDKLDMIASLLLSREITGSATQQTLDSRLLDVWHVSLSARPERTL